MTVQEANELVLAKVPEEKKEEFIKAVTACKSKAEKTQLLPDGTLPPLMEEPKYIGYQDDEWTGYFPEDYDGE